MLHLEPRHIQIVQDILSKQVAERTVIAFGSRVTNKYKLHSDLDICVMGSEPLSLGQLSALKEAFSESDLPIRVDVVDWATISPEFRGIIGANYITIK